MLRRRIIFSLSIVLVLLAFSTLGSIIEYREMLRGEATTWVVFLHGVAYDLCVGCLSVALFVYVVRRRPERRRLVNAMVAWTIAALTVAVYFESWRAAAVPTDWRGNPLPHGDPARAACAWALFAYAIILALALLPVPMRWRESRLIVFCGTGAFLGILLFAVGAPVVMAATATAGAMIWSLAAAAFSHYRYSAFDAAFEHQELRGRYDELSSELARARRLHEALLPLPSTGGAVSVYYLYEPMLEIGGDFLFMPSFNEDASSHAAPTYIIVNDVSGHGVASALAVNRLHGELVRLFAASQVPHALTPAEVMTALNTYVHLTLSPQGVFATGLCIRLEPAGLDSTGDFRVAWSSAGHPPALLRRASTPTVVGSGDSSQASAATAEASIERLDATATMLGVLDPALFDASERSLLVHPGDLILAYTDGLIETRDHSGQEFGIERVVSILREARVQEAASAESLGQDALRPDASRPDASRQDESRVARMLMDLAAETRGQGRVTDDTLIVQVRVNRPATG